MGAFAESYESVTRSVSCQIKAIEHDANYIAEKMRYVEFYDWQYGYCKIASTKLFQEHFGMGLKEAHERTDTLLDKQSFILPVESAEKANEVIKLFTEIGALCRLVEPAQHNGTYTTSKNKSQKYIRRKFE